ncbi:MAG TPA: hypothetical protein VD866_32565 [Urbifossiella sp.]|nr:hypothetical protein [Urbifossiella sp.]
MRVPLVLLTLAAVPAAARAQDALPPAALPPAAPVSVNQTVVIAAPPPDSGEPILGLDVMIGQLSGIRPHVAIHRSDRTALVVEAFYGGILTKLGTSEGAGAGVRYNVNRGERDSVTVGPGVDVLFNFRDGQAVIFAPSVDVAWRRDFGDRVGCVLGIQAGVGVGLSGRYGGRDDKSAAGKLTPLISLFGGLRF